MQRTAQARCGFSWPGFITPRKHLLSTISPIRGWRPSETTSLEGRAARAPISRPCTATALQFNHHLIVTINPRATQGDELAIELFSERRIKTKLPRADQIVSREGVRVCIGDK